MKELEALGLNKKQISEVGELNKQLMRLGANSFSVVKALQGALMGEHQQLIEMAQRLKHFKPLTITTKRGKRIKLFSK